MISDEAKEEVRNRLAIEDVIGEYVPLKRAGRSWRGLSPFSQEKTPSFFVSPDKQIWHDFSSNKGGDIFSFVMEVEGLDFRATLELLARKAGVDLSLYETRNDRGLGDKKKRLYSANELAATFYQRQLIKDSSAIHYVSNVRGLTRQVVMDFRLGYAPEQGSVLSLFMLGKGFSAKELLDAGLTNSRGQDLLRGRLAIPLSDGQGQIVGFTGRLLADIKNAPKYLNTPQTLLYDKGRHVFGLAQAKEAIRLNDYVVLVEGNLDVISSHQAEVKNVVATAGTAMTEHHLKALSRLTHNVRLCFDGDRAGIAATERAIPIAEAVGVELSVITLPSDFKDPDELIKKDAKLWQSVVDSHQPAIEWIIDQYSERYDLTTAAGKRELSTQALVIIRSIKDPVEQEHYLKRVAEVTGASRRALEGKLNLAPRSEPIRRLRPMTVTASSGHDPEVHQDYLLGLALLDESVHDTLRHLTPTAVAGELRQTLLTYLLGHLGKKVIEPLPEELKKCETYVKIVLFKAETRYGTVDSSSRLIEAASLVRRIKDEQLKQTKSLLDQQLREAESAHDEAQIRTLRIKLAELIKESKRARR
ncbi:MAG: DNA primase [Candidatus Saccharimonadales bacterium]